MRWENIEIGEEFYLANYSDDIYIKINDKEFVAEGDIFSHNENRKYSSQPIDINVYLRDLDIGDKFEFVNRLGGECVLAEFNGVKIVVGESGYCSSFDELKDEKVCVL